MAFRLSLLVPALIFAMGAGSAYGVADLLGPPAGARLTSPRPTFTWTRPAGEESRTVYILSAPDTGENGVPPLDVIVSAASPNPDGVSYRPSSPLAAGAYWWTVLTRNAALLQSFTADPVPFTIAPKITVKKPRVTRFVVSNEASIAVMWKSSAKPITVKVRVLKGKKKPKRLFAARKKVRSPSLDRKNTQRFTWKTRGNVREGMKLTLKVTVSGGGNKVVKKRAFRAP